jgi:hypothetical protein
MQQKIDFKKAMPFVIAIVFFLILSYAYFPSLLEGKKLSQHDERTFKGGAKELIDFREQTGEEALWTNSSFVGMPSYLISTRYKGNLLQYINKIVQVGPRPGSYLFILLLGAFLLMLSLKINPWLSIVGAIALAFSSYNFIIILAGHNTKLVAIAYVAPVLAGIFLSFRDKKLLGAAITGLFLSLQILAGHPQITYYTLIIVLIFGLSQLYFAIADKKIKDMLITVGMLSVIVVFAVLSNYSRLATTMEYDEYSMRNRSELTDESGDQTEGLTISYATGWSYGVDETMTLLIPGFRGGSNDVELSENSRSFAALSKLDKNYAKQFIQHVNLYWGKQTVTSGPVYLGAIVVFLFVLGLFIVDKRFKWWILGAAVLGIMLSWGKNFLPLTEFFLNNVPGYNKFRTVSMTLVIPQIVVPILAMLALKKAIYDEVPKQKLQKALAWSAGLTGGLAFLFVLMPSLAGNFASDYDMRLVQSISGSNVQVQQMLTDTLIPALEEDRSLMVRNDAFRSALFILLAAGLLYLYRIRKMKMSQYLVIGLFGFLFLIDMWPVNKRFLNDNNFVNQSNINQPYTPSEADRAILASPGLNNRVLNLTVSPFMDASTSYFHQSIGGYHGAKMGRYQDLINTLIQDEMTMFIHGIQSQDMTMLDSTLKNLNVLNMLNTKYIIINPNGDPFVNTYASGNAWYANDLLHVANADEELAMLARMNIREEVTLDQRYISHVDGMVFEDDPLSSITLLEYEPNKLTYQSSSSTQQLAVFSEIFYDKGWEAYIDGEKVEHFRVDYILRGLVLPEGQHSIVFEFKPKTYYAGEKISYASSIILILLLAGGLFFDWKRRKKELVTS